MPARGRSSSSEARQGRGTAARSRGGAAAQLDEEARAASGAPGGGSGGRARAAGREQGRALAAGERWPERRPARAAAGAAAGRRAGDGSRSLLPRRRMRQRQLRRGAMAAEAGWVGEEPAAVPPPPPSPRSLCGGPPLAPCGGARSCSQRWSPPLTTRTEVEEEPYEWGPHVIEWRE